MALTGLEIYMLLPRTNCGDCGVPTCLAFAMKVASKQASFDECPHVTDEAKEKLGAAGAPPQKLVTIGVEKPLKIGNETVMFRHDEKFYNPCGIAVLVRDTDDVARKAQKVKALSFERIGQVIEVDTVALECASGDGETMKAAATELNQSLAGMPMVLIADSSELLAASAGALAASRPLLWERGGPSDALIELAASSGLPLVVEGDLEKCAADAQKAKDAGIEELVLCPGDVGPKEGLQFLTITRRAATQKSYRPLGYPSLIRVTSEDPVAQSLQACHYVYKYAGIVIMDTDQPEYILAPLVARQSIYIDPQRPVQVEAKIYEVNEPDEKSPFLITTNFSLSYYSVFGEVDGSRAPARILAVDTQGTSVLTAWAADAFGPEQIKKAIEKSGVFDQLAEGYRRPVIPGLVAVISGELSEEIGQEVIVGPQEASGLPRFLKNEWPKLVG
ncbi:MAG: acetyl-CoA decarbonylase/synthase complex subunit gamma [Planctomycetes bacterium]|nr:acetyl-CoA decarbonylase/synthase complex subunit gamma [Planctomycetota bacterium]